MKEYLLKGSSLPHVFLENPLSNLHCCTMKASNAEANLIRQHIQQKDPSTLQCTAQQSVSKLLHLSIFSSYQIIPLRISQSFERQRNSPRTTTVPSSNYCIIGLIVTENIGGKQLVVFFYTGKIIQLTPNLYLYILPFPCRLVNTLLEDCPGGEVST